MTSKQNAASYKVRECLPGPYLYNRSKDGVDDVWLIYSSREEGNFASINFWDDDDGETGRTLGATAKLLAAAPQLLQTMKLVEASMAASMNSSTYGFGDGELYWMVRATVELAETRYYRDAAADAGRPPESETDFGTMKLPGTVQRALAAIYDYLWVADKSDFCELPWSIRNICCWWALTRIKAQQLRRKMRLS